MPALDLAHSFSTCVAVQVSLDVIELAQLSILDSRRAGTGIGVALGSAYEDAGDRERGGAQESGDAASTGMQCIDGESFLMAACPEGGDGQLCRGLASSIRNREAKTTVLAWYPPAPLSYVPPQVINRSPAWSMSP